MTLSTTGTDLNQPELEALKALVLSLETAEGPTDVQIAAACMTVLRHAHGAVGCREALAGWLDSATPPTDLQIHALAMLLFVDR